MLDIKDTVALLIWEVNPCNSSFGNLLVKLYILLVNLRASFQTGKSSNDLIVDKYLNLRFINLPICLSPNQPIENKIKGKCTIGQLKAIGQSTNQYRKQNQKIFCLSQWLNVQDVNLEILYCCLLYTSDAADEEDSVDLGGRRIIKKKKTRKNK